MDQTLSLSWTEGNARSRAHTYTRVLGLNLALHVIIGLYAVIAPVGLSLLLGLPADSSVPWLRAWGGMLLLVTLMYLPGMMMPSRIRWPNIIGILGRFGMGCLFLLIGLLGGALLRGYLWFALFDLAFAVTLATLYVRLFKAQIMSRP